MERTDREGNPIRVAETRDRSSGFVVVVRIPLVVMGPVTITPALYRYDEYKYKVTEQAIPVKDGV